MLKNRQTNGDDNSFCCRLDVHLVGSFVVPNSSSNGADSEAVIKARSVVQRISICGSLWLMRMAHGHSSLLNTRDI